MNEKIEATEMLIELGSLTFRTAITVILFQIFLFYFSGDHKYQDHHHQLQQQQH